MVEQIAAKFAMTRKFLESIGMAPTSCTYRRQTIEKASESEQRDAFIWLMGFDVYIDQYHKAKRLSPDIVHKLYEVHGGSAYEQRQIRMAKKLIFDEWKNRPRILRKHGKSKKKSRSGNR